MRFGIAMPGTGPLSGPAAVAATAQAARELDYASVWSRSTRQLVAIAAQVGKLPVGWLAAEPAGAQRISCSGMLLDAREARGLGSRLKYVGAHESEIAALRRELPGCLLLNTADEPPGRDGADGWSPQRLAAAPSRIRRGPGGPSGLLVLRIVGAPSNEELRDSLISEVDELVVALPSALTLDEQLAGFAEVAERLAACRQKAG